MNVEPAGHFSNLTTQTKLIAIDTISNYIRYPDMKQSEKMSVMNSTKKAINKLNNDMFIKVCLSFITDLDIIDLLR